MPRCPLDVQRERANEVLREGAAPPGTRHRAPVPCKRGFAGTQARPVRSPMALDKGHPGGPRCAGTQLGSAQGCRSRASPPDGSSAPSRGMPPHTHDGWPASRSLPARASWKRVRLVDAVCRQTFSKEDDVHPEHRPTQGPPNHRLGKGSTCVWAQTRPVRPPMWLNLGHPKAIECGLKHGITPQTPRVLSPKGAVDWQEENRCRHALDATSSPPMKKSARDQRSK